MQEERDNNKEEDHRPRYPKHRDRSYSKEKKKNRGHKSDKNKNKRQRCDENEKSRRKRSTFKYPPNSLSKKENVPRENISNFRPVSGSLVKEKNVNNKGDGNISSFDNNRFNNNYHRQLSLFDYLKSDNKDDNSNKNRINSNLINDSFSIFQEVNRINSQDSNNRFPFDMNNNHSSQPNVSLSRNENLLITSELNKQSVEKYIGEINDLKMENAALKKKNQELEGLSLICC